MASVSKEKYHPGIQNGHDGGVHIEGDFGKGKNKGKLMIICHHNTSTKHAKVELNAGDIVNEPSFNEPARKFLVGEKIPKGGVYYYRANKDNDPPHFYAGKTGDLLKRAGQKVRISDKDFVILIRKSKLDMDENWQAQLEHLMYEDLGRRQNNKTVIRLNNDSVAESLCSAKEKKKIRKFFDSMVQCLTQLGAWD